MKLGKIFVAVATVALVAGCASTEEKHSVPDADSPPISTEAPAPPEAPDAEERKLWHDGFPNHSPQEVKDMGVDEVVSTVHNNADLSPGKKIDTVISLAYDTADGLSEDQAEEHTAEVVANFQSREIVNNPDKEFLLRQVYLGALMDGYYDEGSANDKVGFDYMQIARDFYRETASLEDDFIQANLSQIDRELSGN